MMILVSNIFAKQTDNMEQMKNTLQQRPTIDEYKANQNIVNLDQNQKRYQNRVSSKRRNLNNSIDLSQTTVSGLSDFEVDQSKIITVIPRDSLGSPVGDNCDIYIQVSNQ